MWAQIWSWLVTNVKWTSRVAAIETATEALALSAQAVESVEAVNKRLDAAMIREHQCRLDLAREKEERIGAEGAMQRRVSDLERKIVVLEALRREPLEGNA